MSFSQSLVKRDVLVLGGGLTGLAAAYFLGQEELSYAVLEAGPRWGGKVLTEVVEGFLVEGGPDSFITRKPWALELARELGLGDQIRETPAENGKVFVLRDGEPVELPEGMVFVVPTREEPFLASPILSEAGKRRVLAEVDVPPLESGEDESLADFVRRRFGEEALERLGQPLMAGIHAADPERLSLAAAFPEMARMEEHFGSLIRGLRAVHPPGGLGASRSSARVSLAGGIGQLVEALLSRLDPEALHLSSKAVGLERTGKGFRVTDQEGRGWEARSVVVSLPAFAAAELVAGLEPELAACLGQIPYVSTATVSLAFRREEVAHPLAGLGIVFPTVEGRKLQACTWSSSKFSGRAPEGGVLLRAFVGGAGAEHHLERDDDALVALALEELSPLLGLKGAPRLTRVHRWPRSIPQFEIGHRGRVEAVERAVPEGLFLAGTAYRGLGLPDAVNSARKAAEEARQRGGFG